MAELILVVDEIQVVFELPAISCQAFAQPLALKLQLPKTECLP